MPARTVPLVNNEYYHVFNRGINKQPIFLGTRDYKHGIALLRYYSFATQKLRFSKFSLLSYDKQLSFLKDLSSRQNRLVEFVSYCFMPNHFHILLRQVIDNGISKFMSNFQNSYTRYFNTKYKKVGPILQGQFKAVRVEDDGQLLHLSRFIHLNPYTSFIIKDLKNLESYAWSSFPDFLRSGSQEGKDIIISQFKTPEDYKIFVFDNADYQRKLDKVKHLTFEESEIN